MAPAPASASITAVACSSELSGTCAAASGQRFNSGGPPGRPERVEDTAGTDRTDTIEELKQAKPAHLIGRVIGQSQESNEILDVGRAREYMARGRAIRAVGAENSITLRCRTRG